MKGHTRDILHLVLNMEARIENTDFKISIENALSPIAFYQHEIDHLCHILKARVPFERLILLF